MSRGLLGGEGGKNLSMRVDGWRGQKGPAHDGVCMERGEGTCP